MADMSPITSHEAEAFAAKFTGWTQQLTDRERVMLMTAIDASRDEGIGAVPARDYVPMVGPVIAAVLAQVAAVIVMLDQVDAKGLEDQAAAKEREAGVKEMGQHLGLQSTDREITSSRRGRDLGLPEDDLNRRGGRRGWDGPPDAERRRRGRVIVMKKHRVLFVCTHNSARSQMAEGMLRAWGGDRFEVASAGTEVSRVRSEAIAVMTDMGIDISRHHSKSVTEFLGQPWDWVITVCDQARESCPVFPGADRTAHWGFDDPSAAEGTEEERLAVFGGVAREIAIRIRQFIAITAILDAHAGQPETGLPTR